MYVFFVEHVRYIIMYIFRLIKEITHCEYERLKGRDVEVPVLTKEELKKGKSNPCPSIGKKRLWMPFTREWKHSWLASCQLDSCPRLAGDQPWDIQLARRIRGDPNWDVRDYM